MKAKESSVRPELEATHVCPCEEEEQEYEEVEEEADAPQIVRDPRKPTKFEVERHNLTHLPFRDWRPHCVRGKFNNSPHKAKVEKEEDELEEVPRAAMGDLYVGISNEKAQNNPMLIVVDEPTGAVMALVVGRQ